MALQKRTAFRQMEKYHSGMTPEVFQVLSTYRLSKYKECLEVKGRNTVE